MVRIPRVVLAYGLLGILPFLAPPLAGGLLPAFRPLAADILAWYGALILSFLGGARWGLANARPLPPNGVITLSMLPTLVGLTLLLLPAGYRGVQLAGLAIALAVHWIWDITGADLPPWYGRLRTILTGGAVAGLVAGAVVLRV